MELAGFGPTMVTTLTWWWGSSCPRSKVTEDFRFKVASPAICPRTSTRKRKIVSITSCCLGFRVGRLEVVGPVTNWWQRWDQPVCLVVDAPVDVELDVVLEQAVA